MSEPNPIHEAERDEAHAARYAVTEMEWARGCAHEWAADRRYGVLVCRICGETEEP